MFFTLRGEQKKFTAKTFIPGEKTAHTVKKRPSKVSMKEIVKFFQGQYFIHFARDFFFILPRSVN